MSTAVLPLRAEQPDATSLVHLRKLADELRATSRDAAATLVKIGVSLQGVKTMYPQYFDAWVKTELQWPGRLVGQYLRIARAFGDIDWTEAQADPQALMVLTTQYTIGGEQAINAARDILSRGEPLTLPHAQTIKQTANGHARTEEKRERQRFARTEYVPAYPVNSSGWVTLSEIKAAVRNLQVAMTNAYGVPIQPRAVREAFDQLQQLVEGKAA